MNKQILAVLLTASPFAASADVIFGGDVEVNAWEQNYTDGSQDSGDDVNYSFDASIEHPLPLIPNIKFSQSSVNANTYQYTKQDLTLYYEILDNDLVSLDAGVGITYMSDAEYNSQTFDGYLPHVYAAAEVGIPGTPLFVVAKGHGVSYSDHEMYDATAGVQYSVPAGIVDVELQIGYRVQYFRLHNFDTLTSDFDTKTEGFYGGVNVDF